MLSRQTRIWLMLGINGGFFLAEIVVGYYAGSLALVFIFHHHHHCHRQNGDVNNTA